MVQTMQIWLLLAVAACSSLTYGMVIHDEEENHAPMSQQILQEEIRHEQQRQLANAEDTEELDMSQPEAREEYMRWMRELVQEARMRQELKHHIREMMAERSGTSGAQDQQQQQPPLTAHRRSDSSYAQNKRFTDFTTPYLKYKLGKRDNGIWIWMPAQGYVSVPKQQDGGENDISKPGKIMRYGRK